MWKVNSSEYSSARWTSAAWKGCCTCYPLHPTSASFRWNNNKKKQNYKSLPFSSSLSSCYNSCRCKINVKNAYLKPRTAKQKLLYSLTHTNSERLRANYLPPLSSSNRTLCKPSLLLHILQLHKDLMAPEKTWLLSEHFVNHKSAYDSRRTWCAVIKNTTDQ